MQSLEASRTTRRLDGRLLRTYNFANFRAFPSRNCSDHACFGIDRNAWSITTLSRQNSAPRSKIPSLCTSSSAHITSRYPLRAFLSVRRFEPSTQTLLHKGRPFISASRHRTSDPKSLPFDPSCTRPPQPNRDGSFSRRHPPALPPTSRFRHRICSFIWAEIAKGVFTREDWSVFSARILAHKSAAEIARARFEQAKANLHAIAFVVRPSKGRE